ncbi:MAG: hypothetical protein ACKVU4_15670 [Phycisphaerales bacterium]
MRRDLQSIRSALGPRGYRAPAKRCRAVDRAPHALWASILCGCVVFMSGCGGGSRGSAAVTDAASPVVRGARSGLELWSWVVTDARSTSGLRAPRDESGPPGPPDPGTEVKPPPPRVEIVDLKYDVAEVLAPYIERPVPMAAEERARWFAAGLRVVSVPLADLDRVQAHLRTAGPVQRQWLGEKPDWFDAVSGPAFSRQRQVEAPFGPATLEPGNLRLMLRCWLTPDWSGSEASSGPGAALRVELTPEHRPHAAAPASLRAAGDPRDTLMPHLAAHLLMRHEEALLIIPESPDVEWFGPRDARAAAQPSIGPAPPRLPTIGELMLTADADSGTGRRARVIIVLIPRVPDRFRLSAAAD